MTSSYKRNQKSLCGRCILAVFLAINLALSIFALVPQETYAQGETPGTIAYYNARWEEAMTATGYKHPKTYTNNAGVTVQVKQGGPWNLDLDWGNTCSLPWNGQAVAPTKSTTVTTIPTKQNPAETSVTAWEVYTAEQLRRCIEQRQSFKLMKNIDLAGYQGMIWTKPAANPVGTKWVVDGNGKTIYNYYGEDGIFGGANSLDVKNLRIQNSYLKVSHYFDSFFVGDDGHGHSDVALFQCAIEDSLGYPGRSDYNQGSHYAGFASGIIDIDINQCYTNNLHIFAGEKEENNTCSAQIAQGCTRARIKNTFAMNGSVIGTKGHNGGFASCLQDQASIENCFNSNVNVYGNVAAGAFIGVLHGSHDRADHSDEPGTKHTITNCFSSGKVEGTSELGGFIGTYSPYLGEDGSMGFFGSVDVDIKNCYSTVLVGVQAAEATKLGGFIGSNTCKRDTAGIQHTATYTNCYAAGEVGNIQTDVRNERKEANNSIAGFLGNRATSRNRDTFIDCYYDAQMTGMKNWAMGDEETGYAHTSDFLQADGQHSRYDIRGVLTSDSNKSGAGLASAGNAFVPKPGRREAVSLSTYEEANWDSSGWEAKRNFEGFTNNNAGWTFQKDHYPQRQVFSNPTAFTNNNWMELEEMHNLVKACSLASTATARLATWDKGSNNNDLPLDTYDTVRDMTSEAPLTNTKNDTTDVSWNRCGVKGADTLATGSGAKTDVFGTEKDVVTLENDPDPTKGYHVKNPYPGVDWLRATATVKEQSAFRAFRICPTNGMEPGVPNTDINAGTGYDHADDMRMVYTTGARWAANTKDMTYGVYPDEFLATAQDALLGIGGLQNKAALMALYAQPGQNDVYTGVGVGNMQRTSADINKYPAATATTGNTLNTTIRKATGVDSAGNVTYAPVTLNGELGQKFNGNLNFTSSDVGRYLITYDWSLNDGRYLSGTKGVTVRSTPADVAIRVEDETGASVADACGLDAYTGSTPPAAISGTSAADSVGVPLNNPSGVSWTDSSKYSIVGLKATFYDGSMLPHTVTIPDPKVGSTVTVPMTYYLSDTDADGNAVTYSTTVNQTYTITKTGDVYSLVFNKTGTKAEPKSIHGLSYDLSDVQANIEVVLVVKRTDITFQKVGSDGTALSGAGFTLYECTNNAQGHTHGNGCTWDAASPYMAEVTTAANGEATISGVKAGRTYLLAETTVPAGMKDPGPGSYIVVNVAADGTYTMTGAGYFAENGVLSYGQGTGTYTIQNAYGLAEIRIKKTIRNYAAYGTALKDYEFIINLSGDVIASTSLKHGETSKTITHIVDGASDTFTVSEIVPMEFTKTYDVAAEITHADGLKETKTGKAVEVKPGDKIVITVTNTFKHEGYFKNRTWVENQFTK